jgi:hypothetical protein
LSLYFAASSRFIEPDWINSVIIGVGLVVQLLAVVAFDVTRIAKVAQAWIACENVNGLIANHLFLGQVDLSREIYGAGL